MHLVILLTRHSHFPLFLYLCGKNFGKHFSSSNWLHLFLLLRQVKNSPSDYVLSLVTETAEKTQEKLLNDSDLPLLVQIQDGANNSRIFIKERLIKQEVLTDTDVMLPIVDCIEGDDEKIPAEVSDTSHFHPAMMINFLNNWCKSATQFYLRMKLWTSVHYAVSGDTVVNGCFYVFWLCCNSPKA